MESTEWVINFGRDTSLPLLDNCVHAKSCLILWDPMDCSLPGSSVHGIAQARRLEWVPVSFSRASSQIRGRTCLSCVSCISGRVLLTELPGKPGVWGTVCLVTQLCLTLCNPMDCSSPGSSVHRILQAGILEWVPMPSSRESSQPRDGTEVSLIAGGFCTV